MFRHNGLGPKDGGTNPLLAPLGLYLVSLTQTDPWRLIQFDIDL